MNLLKLKKYKGLVSDNEQGHIVHAVNEIMSKDLAMTDVDKSLAQTMVINKNTFHQLTATLNRCPTSNSKCKCMETHINSSNHTFPFSTHVVCTDT